MTKIPEVKRIPTTITELNDKLRKLGVPGNMRRFILIGEVKMHEAERVEALTEKARKTFEAAFNLTAEAGSLYHLDKNEETRAVFEEALNNLENCTKLYEELKQIGRNL